MKRLSVNRITALLSALLILFLCLPISVSAEDTTAPASDNTLISGTAGSRITWTLDTESGVMRMSGDGVANGNCEDEGYTAAAYKDAVKTLILEEGIVAVAENGFKGWSALERVVLPDSVLYIFARAFGSCPQLTEVTMSSHVQQIDEYAFESCALKDITLPSTLQVIKKRAFAYNALHSVILPENLIYIGQAAFYGNESLNRVIIETKTVNKATADALLGEPKTVFSKSVQNVIFKCGDFNPENTTGITGGATDTYDPVYYAPSGGEAEAYCKQKNIRFVPLEQVMLGDMDADGVVTTKDVRAALHGIVTDTVEALDSVRFYTADVNADYRVDTADCVAILRSLTKDSK